jgi:hypothetical protein
MQLCAEADSMQHNSSLRIFVAYAATGMLSKQSSAVQFFLGLCSSSTMLAAQAQHESGFTTPSCKPQGIAKFTCAVQECGCICCLSWQAVCNSGQASGAHTLPRTDAVIC